MEILDIQLRVQGLPALDQTTRAALMAGEALRPLTSYLRSQLLEYPVPSRRALEVQVQDSAVLITEDWTVMIIGGRLIHCVSAMCVLLSLIGRGLQTPVTVQLLTPAHRGRDPLYRMLNHEARKARVKRVIVWGLTIILTVALSVAASLLLGRILGEGALS